MATSTFFTSFKTGPGAKLEGYSGHIYLVPSGSAVNNLMPLTEDTGRAGQYYRENVADGEYKVYIDTDKSGSPVEGDLYKIPGSGNPYLVWHGEKYISDIIADVKDIKQTALYWSIPSYFRMDGSNVKWDNQFIIKHSGIEFSSGTDGLTSHLNCEDAGLIDESSVPMSYPYFFLILNRDDNLRFVGNTYIFKGKEVLIMVLKRSGTAGSYSYSIEWCVDQLNNIKAIPPFQSAFWEKEDSSFSINCESLEFTGKLFLRSTGHQTELGETGTHYSLSFTNVSLWDSSVPQTDCFFVILRSDGGVRFVGNTYQLKHGEYLLLVVRKEDFNYTIIWSLDNKTLQVEKPEILSVQDSDKVVFIGNSITASYYAMRNKSYLSKLSEYTNYILVNLGWSGGRYIDELNRIENDYMLFGGHEYGDTKMTLSRYGVKYIVLSLVYNEDSLNDAGNVNGYTTDFYIDEIKKVVEAAKTKGYLPILATEHTLNYNAMLVSALIDYANQTGTPFYDFGSSLIFGYAPGSVYEGFWGNIHPGTRTNSHTFLSWKEFFDAFKKPQKSLKLFRTRGELTLTGDETNQVSSLNYDTIEERARYFKEIEIGHWAIINPDLYDRIDESVDKEQVLDEYIKLANGSSIPFSHFGLAEMTFDKVDIDKIEILFKSDTELHFWAKTNANSASWNSEPWKYWFHAITADYSHMNAFPKSGSEVFTTPNIKQVDGSSVYLKYKGKVMHPQIPGYVMIFEGFNSSACTSAYTSESTYNFNDNIVLTNIANGSTYTLEHVTLPQANFTYWDKLYKSSGQWELLSDYLDIHNTYDHVITLDKAAVKKYLTYDNLKLLAVKSDGTLFQVSDIQIKYYGGRAKEQLILKNDFLHKSFNEVLSPNTFSSNWKTTEGWVVRNASGLVTYNSPYITFKAADATYKDYPKIPNVNFAGHLEIALSSSLTSDRIFKHITLNNTWKMGLRKVIIRVIAKMNPKIFDMTLSEGDCVTHTRQITPSSFDRSSINIGLKLGNDSNIGNIASFKRLLDLGWHEAYVETYLPPFTSEFDLYLSRNYMDDYSAGSANTQFPMAICYVSVQVEGE